MILKKINTSRNIKFFYFLKKNIINYNVRKLNYLNIMKYNYIRVYI